MGGKNRECIKKMGRRKEWVNGQIKYEEMGRKVKGRKEGRVGGMVI